MLSACGRAPRVHPLDEVNDIAVPVLALGQHTEQPILHLQGEPRQRGVNNRIDLDIYKSVRN